MKINNFISLLVIGVLAILLFMQKCQSGKQVKNLTSQLTESSTTLAKNSMLIDSLLSVAPDTIRDTVINTVSKNFTVTKKIWLTATDTVMMPMKYDTQMYYSANLYNGVDVVTDTITLYGDTSGVKVLTHKQDVFINKDTVRITTTLPVQVVTQIKEVKIKPGFAVWAGIRSDYTLIPHPVLSFSYRDFMISASKGINKKNDFTAQIQAKIRFR